MGRSPAIVWCESCQEWQPCRSENASEWEHDSGYTGQIEFDDGTRGFRRLRHCIECGEVFPTLEVNESALAQRDKAVEAVRKSAAKLSSAVSKLN